MENPEDHPDDSKSLEDTRRKPRRYRPAHGPTIRDDLQSGLHTLPLWMHDLVNGFLKDAT